MKQRNLASLLLAGAMTAALLTGPAQAAESPAPRRSPPPACQAEGLMNGDEHGDLHLDKGLTRAELACLISPIVLNPEHVAWERDYYAKLCTTNFSDVPEWAQVAVGVCASMGVVAGYGDGQFWLRRPGQPADGLHHHAPIPGTRQLDLRYRLRQGGGTGTCPGGDARRRDHHPWRHGPPAHRLPGLSGVPANPINIDEAAPGTKLCRGPLFLCTRRNLAKMKKRLLSLFLAFVHSLGILPTAALAANAEEEALGEVDIYNGGYELSYLTINGRIRTQDYTYFNYVDAKGQKKRGTSHCVNPNIKGVPQTVGVGESIELLLPMNDPAIPRW